MCFILFAVLKLFKSLNALVANPSFCRSNALNLSSDLLHTARLCVSCDASHAKDIFYCTIYQYFVRFLHVLHFGLTRHHHFMVSTDSHFLKVLVFHPYQKKTEIDDLMTQRGKIVLLSLLWWLDPLVQNQARIGKI